MNHGIYQVVGTREYRGHKPGTTFAARLDRPAAQRAINRGDIRFIEYIIPALEPGSFTFPAGWLASLHTQDHRGAERAPLSLREEL